MKHTFFFALAVLVAGTCMAVQAQQAASQPVVPQLIRFGGSLIGGDGAARSGLLGVTFALYKDQTGGAPLWVETQNVKADASGRYTVLLGVTKSEGVPTDMFTSGEARWLGVQVSGEAEKTRVLLVAVPYALKALDAETLGGKPASAFMAAPATGSTATQAIAAGPASTNASGNAPLPPVSGSGKAGDLAVWTSSSKLGDSLLSETTTSVGLSVKGTDAAFTVTQKGEADAIEGTATDSSGQGVGVFGSSAASSGTGVRGSATSDTGANIGVAGISQSSEGIGVSGYESSSSGTAVGVEGSTAASDGAGVEGIATSGSGQNVGVEGQTASPDGYGVYGTSTSSTGGYGVVGLSATGPGVYGETPSTGNFATAVFGNATATTGETYGVSGEISSTTAGAAAVNGYVAATTGTANGVQGETSSTTDGATGVYGYEFATSGEVYGVNGYTPSTTYPSAAVHGFEGGSSGTVYGVAGETNSTGGAGVSGYEGASSGAVDGVIGGTASPTQGATGVFGYDSATSGEGVGIAGEVGSPNGVAGYFIAGSGAYVVEGQNDSSVVFSVNGSGDGYFAGTVTCSNCGGRIDDPVDPANKYLYHSFVESPDMTNVYSGNITTNQNGVATVVLPKYVEALNRDFRYQLTVIGQFAQAIVAQEINQNQFTIKTSHPNVKVSWQITGIRQDPWANAHRMAAEVDKPADKQGYYLHPELYGAGPDKNIHPKLFPGEMKTRIPSPPQSHPVAQPPRQAPPAPPAMRRPLTLPIRPTPVSATSQRSQSAP